MIKVPYFANKQQVYVNDSGYKLTVSTVLDSDYHISITSPDNEYQLMHIPGEVFEQMIFEFITQPKSCLAHPQDEIDEESNNFMDFVSDANEQHNLVE